MSEDMGVQVGVVGDGDEAPVISDFTTTDSISQNLTSHAFSGCPESGADPTTGWKLFNFSLIMFVALVGLVGNILAILTFHKQKRQTSATLFLKLLAVFDMMLIITTNLFSHRYAYTLVFPSAWVNQYTSGKLTIGVLPISYICQTMSTWTVVAVALDRYIHVCHPLKASKWCRIRIARRIMIGIVSAGFVYNIPRFFEYYKIFLVADEVIDPCSGYFLIPEHTLGYNTIYKYSYAFGLYLLIMYIVPLGSLVFFNTKLIRKLRAMNVPGSDGKVEKLKGSDKILPSLIGVVSVFLVCQIPDMVLQILWRINSPIAPTFSIVAYDLIVINSSINFIIYLLAAGGFRRSLMENVLSCLPRLGVSRSEDFSMESSTGRNKSIKKTALHNVEADDSSSQQDGAAGGGGGVSGGREKSVSWKITYTNPVCVDTDSGINTSDSDIHGVWLGDTNTTTNNPTDTTTAAQANQVEQRQCEAEGSQGLADSADDGTQQPDQGRSLSAADNHPSYNELCPALQIKLDPMVQRAINQSKNGGTT